MTPIDYQRTLNNALWASRPLERLQRLQTENLWLRWVVAILWVMLIYNST